MTRLTKKNDKDFYTSIPNFPYDNRFEIIQKLGKLEDLEEQLGCPLEVMFKALEEGIRTITNNIRYVYKMVRMSNGCLAFELELAQYFYLKDYQKTWWLKGEKPNE